MTNINTENNADGYENTEAENKEKAQRNPQEDKLHDSLKDQGLDDEEAAAIANTHNVGYGDGDAHIYEAMSMEDLYTAAKEKGVDGYYDMRRTDIVAALKEMRTED